MKNKRRSGILLHPTSLPGKYGIGTLGRESYEFIDFLASAGQKLWQILPLGHTGYGDSPYQCFSTFAGNPLLISIDALIEKDWVHKRDIPEHNFPEKAVDFGPVIDFKYKVLWTSWINFNAVASREDQIKFSYFCDEQIAWIDDYALFMELKNYHKGNPWYLWSDEYRFHLDEALQKFKSENSSSINYWKYLQWIFFSQWAELKAYAGKCGLEIIGDIPLYIAFDSADAWSNPNVFQFDDQRNPVRVAGVPPDYFSETGQLWGNPLYNWDYLRSTGYSWWVERVRKSLEFYDIIRIDHFRGLAAYWAVPFTETTAIRGEWVEAPGWELFEILKNQLGEARVIAEDLGVITPDVEALRDHFGFPGMKVLQFGFQPMKNNEYLPHNYQSANCLCYTGSHDNNTILGWYKELDEPIKANVLSYLPGGGESIAWKMIRIAWASNALYAVTTMQDLLEKGGESRMNTPGIASGNWQWRFRQKDYDSEIVERLKLLTVLYDRN
jgi:4-alpha-glucanotransferase